VADAREHVGDRIRHHRLRVSYSIRLHAGLVGTVIARTPTRRPALPARLPDTRDLPPQRHLAEADPAQPELAQERPRPPAPRAPVALANRELLHTPRLLDQCLSRHDLLPVTPRTRTRQRCQPPPASPRGTERPSPSTARTLRRPSPSTSRSRCPCHGSSVRDRSRSRGRSSVP